MIYLIGGPPRTGKSSVAARLAATTGCSWCPTDYLASAIFPYGYGPDGMQRPDRLLPDAGNDERYAAATTDEIVANYRARARYYELGITRGFIEYAAADGRDFVVEGFHLEPHSMVEASRRWPGVVRCLLLVRTDFDDLVESIPRGAHANDWAVRDTKRPETFGKIAEMVVRYSEALSAEAADLGCPVLDMSAAPLESSLDRAVALLTEG